MADKPVRRMLISVDPEPDERGNVLTYVPINGTFIQITLNSN